MGCGGGDDGSNPVNPPGGDTNHAPTVNLNINNTHLAYGGAAQLSVGASDLDGDQVTLTWSAVLGTVSTSGPTSKTATFTAGNQWGQASVTVTASDGKGGTAQATALTYIRNPTPPQVCFAPPSGGCSAAAYPLTLVAQLEAILVTRVAYQSFDNSNCGALKDYSPPLTMAQDVPHEFGEVGCASCPGQTSGVGYTWYVSISCRRPEPDGGGFLLSGLQWNPTAYSQFETCFR
jgi:hypothetical protein